MAIFNSKAMSVAIGRNTAVARVVGKGAAVLTRDARPTVTRTAPNTAGITLPGRQNSRVMLRAPTAMRMRLD
jgi:hypothetical protein